MLAVRVQFLKGHVLDGAIKGDTSSTRLFGLLLLLFIALEIGCYFVFDLVRGKFTVRSMTQLKGDYFKSLLRRKYRVFMSKTTGEYIAQYTNEMDMVENQYFTTWPLLAEVWIKIVTVSVSLFLLDYRIALVTLCLLTTPLYVPKLAEKKLQKAQTACVTQVERHLRKLNDWLRGFEVIKNYSAEETIAGHFDESNREAQNSHWQKRRMSYIMRSISATLSYVSHYIIIVIAAYFVLIKEFSAGSFFIAVGMIDQLSYPIISLSYLIQDVVSVKPVCASLSSFCAYETETGDQASRSAESFEMIEFSDVTFGFDNRRLFSDLSMSFEKNKRYLIRGASGSGKTTAMDLLLNYYAPASGTVTIDGKPVEALRDIYRLVTVMRQEAFLFEDSLRNNLTMYRTIPDEKLIATLETVGLARFASRAQLDMVIQSDGDNLSGGEKKRIALARSLLRETPVLILDEPLANLDDENVSVIESLLLSITDRTVIIISHQFSKHLLDRFEQIYCFNEGIVTV